MNNSNEKSESHPAQNIENPGRTPLSRNLIAALAGVLALAAVVFFLVSSRGRIPMMPRAEFSPQEEAAALKELEGRIRGFAPTDEERDLIRRLAEINLTETAEDAAADKSKINEQIESFRAVASRFAVASEERYLLVGDFLAVEFDRALATLLKEFREGSKNNEKSGGDVSLERVKKLGGSFFSRCVTRGAITRDGRLLASRIAPEVLFRVRWRLLGDLRLETGLSPVEKRAHWDFVAAFTTPRSDDQRLAAIKELGSLDKNYDTTVAKALVLHQAGKDEEAYKLLEDAVSSGKSNAAVADFAKAIRK